MLRAVHQPMRRVTLGTDSKANFRALIDAVVVLARGGLVAIPTDTLYGLAVDPFSPAAIARLMAVKERAAAQAIALIGADTAQVIADLGALPPVAQKLASRYWPGPLTLLVPRPLSIPAELTGGSPLVGVRVPNNDAARELCRFWGHVLTATSANLSGEPASDDPDHVARVFHDRDVGLLLDSGKTKGGPPSTVVQAVDDDIRLIRPGAIGWDEVLQCVRTE
jgi:L-threonylcarbamoyladenylate synthase